MCMVNARGVSWESDRWSRCVYLLMEREGSEYWRTQVDLTCLTVFVARDLMIPNLTFHITSTQSPALSSTPLPPLTSTPLSSISLSTTIKLDCLAIISVDV